MDCIKLSKVVPHELLEKLIFAYSKGELPISFAPLSFSPLIVNRLLPVLVACAAAEPLVWGAPTNFLQGSSWPVIAIRSDFSGAELFRVFSEAIRKAS